MALKQVTNPFSIAGRLAAQGLEAIAAKRAATPKPTAGEVARWISEHVAAIDSAGAVSAIAVATVEVRIAALVNEVVTAPTGRRFDLQRLPPEVAKLLEEVRGTHPAREHTETTFADLEHRILSSRLPSEALRLPLLAVATAKAIAELHSAGHAKINWSSAGAAVDGAADAAGNAIGGGRDLGGILLAAVTGAMVAYAVSDSGD